MISLRSLLLAATFPAVCAVLLAAPALAHVTLDVREAPVGGSLRVAFRVGHGCGGSPTVNLRVRIPDGVIAVKPMPKPGWQIESVVGKYDKAYPYFHGATLSEGVREIAWRGGKLEDAHYDEFVLSAFLSGDLRPNTMLYFPVVQECESGVQRWIEIPAAGKSADDTKEPAPGLKLVPRSSGQH